MCKIYPPSCFRCW